MTEKEKKAEIVRYWWDRAQESLEAARRELAAASYNFAMNRVYYALFYAVSALLLEEGHRFKKHSGVRVAFNREIIKAGRMEQKHGRISTTRYSMSDRWETMSPSLSLTLHRCKRKREPVLVFYIGAQRSAIRSTTLCTRT